MGLFDRVSRLVRSNLNALVSGAEDPEKILDQALVDMQEDQIQMRQAVAQAIASMKRLEQQYQQNASQADEWYRRAELALQKGEEDLARQALTRRKTHQETATALKAQIDQQQGQVENLKRNLLALESKIAEAKTKKDMLKARLKAAKATEQIQEVMGKVTTSGSMAAFERMEEKVLSQEARSQAVAELAGDDLERQFAKLEGGTDVDTDLLALKAKMGGGVLPAASQPTAALPQGGEVVDGELEELRARLNQP